MGASPGWEGEAEGAAPEGAAPEGARTAREAMSVVLMGMRMGGSVVRVEGA
jgi:hypothetical protein